MAIQLSGNSGQLPLTEAETPPDRAALALLAALMDAVIAAAPGVEPTPPPA